MGYVTSKNKIYIMISCVILDQILQNYQKYAFWQNLEVDDVWKFSLNAIDFLQVIFVILICCIYDTIQHR